MMSSYTIRFIDCKMMLAYFLMMCYYYYCLCIFYYMYLVIFQIVISTFMVVWWVFGHHRMTGIISLERRLYHLSCQMWLMIVASKAVSCSLLYCSLCCRWWIVFSFSCINILRILGEVVISRRRILIFAWCFESVEGFAVYF